MKNIMKTVIAILLVAMMCVGMFPLTAHAAGNGFITLKFDMPEGCTYPIFVEILELNTYKTSTTTLYHTNGYTQVMEVEPGRYCITAMVAGDASGKYPINIPDIYDVAENANALVEMSWAKEIADKAVADSAPPVVTPTEPTEPSEPETQPTEPEKQPGEDKPEVPPVDNNPSKNPGETEKEPVETPFNWGPFIRAGIFVGIAGVVMLAMVIKKKRDEAALGGDDD